MILCYEEPEMVETVLEKVTEFFIAYTTVSYTHLDVYKRQPYR